MSDATGIISEVISIVDATIKVYNAAPDDARLPPNFKTVSTRLHLVFNLLDNAEGYVKGKADDALAAAFTRVLTCCKKQATQLQQLFNEVIPTKRDSRDKRDFKAAQAIDNGSQVATLMKGILHNLQLLATKFPESMSDRGKSNLGEAIEKVSELEPCLPIGEVSGLGPSLPGGFGVAHYGSGPQNVHTGPGHQYNYGGEGNQNIGSGNQYIGINHIG
ncbi:hypothetical protein PWT90_03520 [Aphanocladium album]|nr:hypothetical protein PWT90_03520 [Aphanocladium album]